MPRILVIGAGISGLAFAKTYLHLTNYYASTSPPKPPEKFPSPTNQSSIPDSFTSPLSSHDLPKPTESHDILIVDENPSLGGSWCRSRIYPNLYTQNALGTYEFSDMPLEGEGVANEAGYIAGWKLEEYLVAWSEKWELKEKMRFGVKVSTIYRDPTTHEWVLNITQNPPPESPTSARQPGKQFKLYCDKLVLAVGTSSEPNKPDIPGQEAVNANTMIHSVELGNWSRAHLGIDVDYHHEPSSPKHPSRQVLASEATIRHSLEKPRGEAAVVEGKYPPTPPPSPVIPPSPPAPLLLPRPPKRVAIYGGRKSAFDIVYFFATLPEHLRPEEIEWIFRPSASTPSRFAAQVVGDAFPLSLLRLPSWVRGMLPLPAVPVRMDELMAVRLVGLFERCGFESVVGGSLRGSVLGVIPGFGRFVGRGVRKGRNVLGQQGKSWVGRLLQETTLGRGLVDALWSTLDKAWEAAEGIGAEDGEVYKLRPGTSSGSCSTSFLITNQPGFWEIVRQPNIHIHRAGAKHLLMDPGLDNAMQIQLNDGTHVSSIELLIMATGWKTSFPFAFDPPELSAQLGLPYQHSPTSPPSAQAEIDKIVAHWGSLEFLAQQRFTPRSHRSPESLAGANLPLRLFRNMVSPELTASAEKDRSLLVLGMAKSWQTMIVSEVQALWGAVYLLGGFDDGRGKGGEELDLGELGKKGMEERIAEFEAFGKGTGGGVLLVDSLKYCDVLLRDLGLCPWRKSMGARGSGWRDWVGVHRPGDYRGIVGEWMEKRRG